MKRAWLIMFVTVLSLVSVLSATAFGQTVGRQYFLDRPGKTIPGHPGPGMHAISIRFPHGSIARVLAMDQQTGWYEVKVEDDSAWIVKKYFGDEVEPLTPEIGLPTYRVGTWNG